MKLRSVTIELPAFTSRISVMTTITITTRAEFAWIPCGRRMESVNSPKQSRPSILHSRRFSPELLDEGSALEELRLLNAPGLHLHRNP